MQLTRWEPYLGITFMETKQVKKQNRFSSGVKDWLLLPRERQMHRALPLRTSQLSRLSWRIESTVLCWDFFLIQNESAEDLVQCSEGGGG